MRFIIEFKDFKTKETEDRSLDVLQTFLNEHLIGQNHGNRFECIIIRFIANPSASRKLQLKTLYHTYAVVEVGLAIEASRKVQLVNFMHGLMQVESAIRKAAFIETSDDNMEYQEEELVKEYRKALAFAPKSIEDLKRYAKNQKEIEFNNQVKRTDCAIRTRLMNPSPLNKRLKDIVVSQYFDEPSVTSYAYRFTEVLSNLLFHAEVMLPGYDRIVIKVDQTIKEAKQEMALEDWYSLTFTALDINKFLVGTDAEKFYMLFESIQEGIRLIANFDHLEKEKIEEVMYEVAQKSLNMELVYVSKGNEKYLAQLIYQVPKTTAEKADFKLKLTDLASGQTGTVTVASAGTFRAAHCFNSISIKKKEIVIKGRKSYQAEITRKMEKLPEKFTFDLSEVLK